jgi:hypothetical protein
VPYAGSEFPSVQSQSLGGQALVFNIPGVVNDTSLNRGFGSGNVVQFLQIVDPGTMYGDRLNAVDLRFGKILRYGGTKTQLNLDVYNLFNSNTTEVYQRNYGPTWLNPLSIMSARFFKISAQFDF